MRLDELSDFNSSIKYYREILSFAKTIRPTSNPRELLRYSGKVSRFPLNGISQASYYRIMCSNISLYISQLHEKSIDASDEVLKDISFDEIESIDSIQVIDREDTLMEKKKQIRNCLAHSSYRIIMNNVRDITKHFNDSGVVAGILVDSVDLEFDNGHIKGRIPFEDIKKFAEKYTDAYSQKFANNNTISFIVNPNIETARSKQELMDAQKKVRILPIDDFSGLELEKVLYRLKRYYKFAPETVEGFREVLKEWKEKNGHKSFDMREEEIPNDKKTFINRYIDYVGFKNIKEDVFPLIAMTEIIAPIFEGVVSYHNLTGIVDTFNKAVIIFNNVIAGDYAYAIPASKEITDEVSKYVYESPMIYANNLLGLSYYCFNYVKGLNDINRKVLFNMYDMDELGGLSAKVISNDGTESIVPVEQTVNANNELEVLLREPNDQLVKIQKEIAIWESSIEKLENPKNKNPKKEELLAKKRAELEQKKKVAEEKQREIEQYKRVYTTDKEVVKDSSNFFRHIRNSLAHGNYEIDYKDYNDLDSITFRFRDYDEATSSTYEVELTAKKLEEIIEAFQKKVNEGSKDYVEAKIVERQMLEYALRKAALTKQEVDGEIVEHSEGDNKPKDGESLGDL